jgi:penicillin-binding protein 1A
VHNYEDEYLGSITIQQATAYSDNAVFAQLTKLVGPQNIANTAKSLGIKSRLQPYFSIGLGAQGVNPLEMARAFSAFANGGKRIDGRRFGNEPRVITKVANEKGRPIDDNTARPVQALSEENAALVTSLLQNVIKYGTGKAAVLSGGRPAAGKTGTTENYGDAWFVGYTPQLVTAVWVGYPNDVRSMSYQFHGKPVAGGTFPALIWKSFMENALPYLHDAPRASRRRRSVRLARRTSPTGTAGSSSPTPTAATRSRSSTSATPGRRTLRTACRTRSTCRTWSASRWARRRRSSRGSRWPRRSSTGRPSPGSGSGSSSGSFRPGGGTSPRATG